MFFDCDNSRLLQTVFGFVGLIAITWLRPVKSGDTHTIHDSVKKIDKKPSRTQACFFLPPGYRAGIWNYRSRLYIYIYILGGIT